MQLLDVNETEPICTSCAQLAPFTMRGPPESPGQKPLSPTGQLPPAQIMELVEKVLSTCRVGLEARG